MTTSNNILTNLVLRTLVAMGIAASSSAS